MKPFIKIQIQINFQMCNARAVQMTISLDEMVICLRNHIMIDLDIMAENGIMKSVATIAGLKIYDRNLISIIVSNQADELETVATNNALNVM